MTGIALYDMDRTITRRPTYAAWLVFWAAREAPWRLLLVPVACLCGAAYLLRLVGRARLKELNQRLLMGRGAPRAAVEAHATSFAARIVARGLLPGAVAQIAADRAEGRRLVMATASYGFYAGPIGRALGFDAVIATRSVWDGDRLRPRIAGANCYGPDKRAMVDDWLGRQGQYGPVRFYSDHVSDAPVFERADEAVAATPSAALRVLAQERGWRVVDWR